MKAIKDARWFVIICKSTLDSYWWVARTSDNIYDGKTETFGPHKTWKIKYSAQRNWKKFAKLNGIKKWEYINK